MLGLLGISPLASRPSCYTPSKHLGLSITDHAKT